MSIALLGYLIAFSFALRTLTIAERQGDRALVLGLLKAITYLDKHIVEWPDAVHKARVSLYISSAAACLPEYTKQSGISRHSPLRAKADDVARGLRSYRDKISMSDKDEAAKVRDDLVDQLTLFLSGRWDLMTSSDAAILVNPVGSRLRTLVRVCTGFTILVGIAGLTFFFDETPVKVAGGIVLLAILVTVLILVSSTRFMEAFRTALTLVRDRGSSSSE